MTVRSTDPQGARQRQSVAKTPFAPWDDPTAVPIISYRGVSKRFEDVVAVDNLSLDIYPREFFALLGPSGCGKTTLMRLLAGFEEPSDGRVMLEGKDLAGVPPHRRPVNMMFQSYALFPHLSVKDNIAFGLRRDGLPRREVARRVDEMLTLVQLTAQARRKPHQLSGGQRQRVALARSLAKKPRVLLLDEPLGALDKRLRGETQFQLVNLQYKLGITFLVVTHDQDEAFALADRIAIMRDGRIEQVAPPARLYESPASRYVADFVGDVNLFDGTVREATGVTVVTHDASGLAFAAPPSGAVSGSHGCVAVRPEKLVMHLPHEAPDAPHNRIEGTVEDIAYGGDFTLFRVKTPTGIVEASVFNHRRTTEKAFTWDDPVVLTFDASDTVFLDH
ncbi:polyamine ABC transporter ATP-binding protein [Acuticoccus sediminis]|uniref:Spermidine/putrescine import ATP-binding protein PotA n=1 Tax=Acuticoccus sediminis TaxID=2184697 RepID=A0A8B2NFL5_9HYPH|nr:ABC transporter ATP-binding protein [Acuticoccus sediminis]RAH97689.1 polyamine ABC transporter ATP-binding protein [Acuticoccus sediminis]